MLAVALDEDHAMLASLLNGAHEDEEGVFYVSTTDAWVTRSLDGEKMGVRIEFHDGDEIRVAAEAYCEAPSSLASSLAASLAPETLFVTSDAKWSVLEERLRTGEEPIVIFGPKPGT